MPDIPEERLDLPPIPLPSVDTSSQTSSQIDLSDQGSSSSSSSSQGNNHLPGQQQVTSTQTASSSAPTTSGQPPPPQGNTFLNALFN